MQRMIDNIGRSNSSSQHNSRGTIQTQNGSSGTVQAQRYTIDLGNANNDTFDQGTYTTGKFTIVFHKRKENNYLRLKRVKMSADDSEPLRVIELDAFGEDYFLLEIINDIQKYNNMSTLAAIEQYMSIYGTLVLTTLGIIGNILSILIFLSPRYRRQSSHFYLLCLALSDLCFLIINLFEDTFRNHNQVYKSHINFLDRSSSLICIFVQYARNVTRSLSSWIIVSFTIERLLVVFHPLKRAIICRRKIARFVVCILFSLSFVSNINVPFHYGIITQENSTRNDSICDIIPEHRQIYMRFAIATMTTVYLVPMCIIGLVNMLICCKLWRKSLLMENNETNIIPKERHRVFSRRHLSHITEFLSCLHISRRSSTSSSVTKQSIHGRTSSFNQYQSIGPVKNGYLSDDENRSQPLRPNSLSSLSVNYTINPKHSVTSIKTYIQSRTHRVTATLLLVSFSFLVLNTPYCVVWIANYAQSFRNDTLRSIKEITELFMLTNFCINFLLYCVSGKVFRGELICLLRCRWRELYDRNETERMARRRSRPRNEIQLNEPKLKTRSLSINPNDQLNRPSVSSIYTSRVPST
ncbi:unnamed protein product [Adineta steineri]|uniref:G-protein coupled receptors family 1 profile domain-containing protein n=2 Tax=Adineta steineri TaxID=433720 RepID=A0A814SCE3_9BILA|nr:unnamed protein product [Adineta steineri]